MTPDDIKAQCEQVIEQLMTFDLPATEEDGVHLAARNMALLESLCREMLAKGLEMATYGLKVDNTTLRWALKELGPTGTNAEAYAKSAVEQVIWCREQANKIKESTCDTSSS